MGGLRYTASVLEICVELLPSVGISDSIEDCPLTGTTSNDFCRPTGMQFSGVSLRLAMTHTQGSLEKVV